MSKYKWVGLTFDKLDKIESLIKLHRGNGLVTDERFMSLILNILEEPIDEQG